MPENDEKVEKPSKPKCTCGICWECLDLTEVNPVRYSFGTPTLKRAIKEIGGNEVLERAVWKAWKQSRLFLDMPQISMVERIKELESEMRFITEIFESAKVESIRKKNNDPAVVREFRLALKARQEAAGAKKTHKHSKKPVTEGAPVSQARGLKYKTDNPQEKNLIEAIYQMHKNGMLELGYAMIKKSNPNLDVDAIRKRMGL